jgi:four helix bundle protein
MAMGSRIKKNTMPPQCKETLPKSRTSQELLVWQKAHEFVLAAYRLSDGFPQREVYGLTAQLRRAAVSIAANIAEGYKKFGKADKLRFLNTAQGSLEECRYFLMLSRDLQYGDTRPLQPLLDETSKLLEAYSSAIRRRFLAPDS